MSKQFKVEDIPDLTGKVAIVTGGAGSIGLETVYLLALKGCTVYIAGRNSEKATVAIESLRSRLPSIIPVDERLKFHFLDLQSIRSSVSSAKEFISTNSRLDILITNAATAMDPANKLTSEGYETTFAINHLGHFAFVTELLPLLEQTAKSGEGEVRVVITGSEAHRLVKGIDFDEVVTQEKGAAIMGGMKRYGRSKLANLLFGKELDRKVRGKGIRVNIGHPGMVAKTTLGGNGSQFGIPSFITNGIRSMLDFVGLSALEGAMTQFYLATSPEVLREDIHGKYFVPHLSWSLHYQYSKESEPNMVGNDEELAKNLWEFSEEAVNEALSTDSPPS
ncbi:hypothetical protein RUND412_002088 [Rhizina undulata]